MDGAPGQDEGELGRVDGAGEEGWYVTVLPFLLSFYYFPLQFLPPKPPPTSSQELGRGERTQERTELTQGENSVLYRLRRPRAPRPAPARRRLEGRRVHGARRRGQLRVVRRDTHGCEGNPGDHE
jgi:hypothetical protein